MKILVISGPTATGKTKLALQLAHEFNGEIISADSRQIYIGMDIGTGKDVEKGLWDDQNQAWVIEDIPIYMLDRIFPDSNYHVAQYISGAGEAIEKIIKQGKLPIIVGGTGFYIRSLINPPETLGIPQNLDLRKNLNDKTREELKQILKDSSPEKYLSMNNSDQNNPRRLIRAIETANYQGSKEIKENKYSGVVKISLTAPLPHIYKLADQRIDEMVINGILEEIKSLLKKYTWGSPGLKTIGYIEFKDYFENTKPLADCIQKLKFNHHSLIRRQVTWFKKEKIDHLIDVTKKDPFEEAVNILKIAFGSS